MVSNQNIGFIAIAFALVIVGAGFGFYLATDDNETVLGGASAATTPADKTQLDENVRTLGKHLDKIEALEAEDKDFQIQINSWKEDFKLLQEQHKRDNDSISRALSTMTNNINNLKQINTQTTTTTTTPTKANLDLECQLNFQPYSSCVYGKFTAVLIQGTYSGDAVKLERTVTSQDDPTFKQQTDTSVTRNQFSWSFNQLGGEAAGVYTVTFTDGKVSDSISFKIED